MVMHMLCAVLIVIVILLHLLVTSFGPVPPMHHVHASEKHYQTHYDYHDYPPLQCPNWMSQNG